MAGKVPIALMSSAASAERAEQGPAERIQRVEPEGTPDVDALGAVMHLVGMAPQPVKAVHGAVPPVDPQLIDEEAADHLQPQGIGIGRDQAVLAKSAVPQQRRISDDGKVTERRKRTEQPPLRHFGNPMPAAEMIEQREQH
jgi:hypothetical protein